MLSKLTNFFQEWRFKHLIIKGNYEMLLLFLQEKEKHTPKIMLCLEAYQKIWALETEKPLESIENKDLALYLRKRVVKLRNKMLEEVPKEVFLLKYTSFLDLSGNHISDISTDILKMPYLEALGLSQNKLREVSESILKLKRITYLSLDDNLFSEVPPTIVQMKSLKFLSIGGTNIKSIPKEITKMNNLEYFHLTNNQITELPKETIEWLKEKNYAKSANIKRLINQHK